MIYFKKINGENIAIIPSKHSLIRFKERVENVYNENINDVITNSIYENSLVIKRIKAKNVNKYNLILLDSKCRFYMILKKTKEYCYVIKTIIPFDDRKDYKENVVDFQKEKMLFVKKTIWNNQKRDYFKNDEDFDLLNSRMFAKISH